jgi:hypothetical protein
MRWLDTRSGMFTLTFSMGRVALLRGYRSG